MNVGRTSILVFWAALSACADLSPIPEAICGNGVLDQKEDCDPVDASLGTGTACGESTNPAPEQRCRYVCPADTRCPLGWDCGADAICRQPSAKLEEGVALPNWSPNSFEPVDFNGDGRVDLVGAFGDGVQFCAGEVGGTFAEAIVNATVPATGSVSAGEFDGDSFGDVILPTERGFSVWRGQATGSPLPVAFAPYFGNDLTGLRLLPMRHPAFPEGVVALLFPDLDGASAIGTALSDAAGLDGFGRVLHGHTFEEIGERLVITDLERDLRDELVIGFESESVVHIVGVRMDPWSGEHALRGLSEVEVGEPQLCEGCTAKATGLRIDRGVHVTDVDGDGNLDLLVSVVGQTFESGAVVVVKGDGSGGFATPYLDARFEALAEPSTVTDGLVGSFSVWPIAAGDLDGDGDADYVSPNGLFLAGSDELSQALARITTDPWTAAIIRDVDGNQEPDVVAIVDDHVDVVRCFDAGSSCVQRGQSYVTGYPVRLPRAGSFQGPPTSDIVLVESAPADSPEDDALSVMFGVPDDFPEAPVRQARVHRIDHIETGRVSGWPTLDSYDDVLLSARTRSNEVAAGIFWANGTKLLSSPYFAESVGSPATMALSGRFTGPDQKYDDVVLFGESEETSPRVWWVPGVEGGAFAPTSGGQDLAPMFGDPQFSLDCARFEVGEIDGDGREDVVAVFDPAFDPEACGTPAKAHIAVGRVSETGQFTFQILEDLTLGEGEGGAVTLADVDGNGRDDLVLARTGRVEIFHGPFGAGASSKSVALPKGEQVIDVTAFSRSEKGRGGGRVAVLTDTSVWVLSDGGLGEPAPSGGASVVRSADVDADGLGDLLLLGDDGVRVLLTVPAPPLGGG